MLLFDLTATQASGSVKRHGGGIYGEIVLRRLIEKNNQFIAYYDSYRWINPDIIELCKKHNIITIDIKSMSISDIVNRYNISLIYSALDGNGLSEIHCKKIITVHGLRRFETTKDKYQFKYKYGKMELIKEFLKAKLPYIFLRRERKFYVKNYFSDPRTEIVTVSNHSLNSLITYFPEISVNKIRLHILYSPSTSLERINIPVKSIDGEYYLIVSGNRWNKNALRAVIAFERLIDLGYLKDKKLVITGVHNNSFRYKFKHPNQIIFKGYVKDNGLESLYKYCELFIFPSLNEGFGYPPLEAMKYGRPVIASAVTSIPEVCGDAAMYFSPYSIEEIMNRMLQMQNKITRDEYSIKAINRYSEITSKQIKDLDKLIDLITEKV